MDFCCRSACSTAASHMNRPLFPMDVLMILMESRNQTTDVTDQFCIMYICRKQSAVESYTLSYIEVLS